MQDNLDIILQGRYKATPRMDLADDIIRATHYDQKGRAVAFFMFRPRYTYAVLGLIIVTAIALIASMPQGPSYTLDESYSDISTYMVYDTLMEFDASV